MPKFEFIEETGKRYGRLVVEQRVTSSRGNARFICTCDCGNRVVVRGNNLRQGMTRSCGCLRRINPDEFFAERISSSTRQAPDSGTLNDEG
jgi:hypothetical protein